MRNIKVSKKESTRANAVRLIDLPTQVRPVIAVAGPEKSCRAHGDINLMREIEAYKKLRKMMTSSGKRALGNMSDSPCPPTLPPATPSKGGQSAGG